MVIITVLITTIQLYNLTYVHEYTVCSHSYIRIMWLCLYSEEVKEFTPKYNAQMLSESKECNCLFYYAEHDPDEYKKQGKDWMKVSN